MWLADTPPSSTSPDWTHTPPAAAIVRYYPDVALKIGLSGRAVLSCEVTEIGSLKACMVAEESPHEAGFGSAVLRMSKLFKMKPKTEGGKPVAGGTVRIPVRFTPPPGRDEVTMEGAEICYGVTARLADSRSTSPQARDAAAYWKGLVAKGVGEAARPGELESRLKRARAKAAASSDTFAKGACLARASATMRLTLTQASSFQGGALPIWSRAKQEDARRGHEFLAGGPRLPA